jgi:class 3 adenylate cyclase
VATLDAKTRARLPDSAFAYVDSEGRRRLPINDVSHVRNALARFEQVAFEDDDARERARQRLLRAAKRYGIVPLGFFDGQLRKERLEAELAARATDVRKLPRGAVTFLFTDIEGSTRLVQRLGDRYAALLRAVRTIIRSRVRRAGGVEVDARADEFFGAFDRITPALAAAVEIQRCLAERRWPRGVDVRVRIGLHTGRPKLTDTGYVGIAVHTAARVCSAGHGGQILLSAAAREAMGTSPAGLTLRSLGTHELAGLPDAEELFQVVAAGLATQFPAPRTAASAARG